MQVKKMIYSFLFALLFANIGHAQLKCMRNAEATEKLSEKVANLFDENEISDAFDLLSPYWPLSKSELKTLEDQCTKHMDMLEEKFGEVQDVTKVKSESIPDVAIQETYFLRYKYTATRLIFTYYKGKKGWVVNAFEWDESFDEEFE